MQVMHMHYAYLCIFSILPKGGFEPGTLESGNIASSIVKSYAIRDKPWSHPQKMLYEFVLGKHWLFNKHLMIQDKEVCCIILKIPSYI